MSDKENRIVVNTSPWIALSICGQIPLLKKIYGEVHVPVGVKEEILAGGKQGIGVREIEASSWVRIGRVIDIEKVTLLFELDRGEAEVIILAKEKGIKRVLMDEKVARLQAEVLGLNVIGTLGLLLRAKKSGIISSIKPLVEKMLENGIWIKDEIVEGILRDARED